MDNDDLALFRDHVLVLSLGDILARPRADAAAVEELIALVAMTPDPTEGPALAAWQGLLATMQKSPEHYDRAFAKHRGAIKRERTNPPAMVRKASFCGVADSATESDNP